MKKALSGILFPLILNLQLFADVETTVNATKTSDIPTNWKTYWDTALLKNARANLIFDQFGKKEKIKGGKVEFRKWNTFPKAMTPLTEGVTPTGSKFGQSAITAQGAQYGDYTTITDRLEAEGFDDTKAGATEEMGVAGAETFNALTRDVLSTGTAVAYAPKLNGNGTITEISSRADITPDCKLTPTFVKKANTWLKKNKAPTFEGGNYVMLIHPSVSEDFRNTTGWEETVKYTTPEKLFAGEIGRYDNFRFIENTECKTIAPGEIVYGENRFLCTTAIASSTTSVAVTPTSVDFTGVTTKSGLTVPVYVNGVANTVTAITVGGTSSAPTYTLTLGTAISSLAVGAMICGKGAGKDGSTVYHTLALGKDAYGLPDTEGENFEMIIKGKEHGGPLNLWSTIGYKFWHCCAILYQDRMIRLESGSSYSYTDETN